MTRTATRSPQPLNGLAGISAVCLLSVVTPALAGGQTLNTPGQQVTVPLTVSPSAIAFDVGNSTLYAVVQQSPSSVFGSIDPFKGTFTPIPQGSSLPLGSLSNSIFVANDSFSQNFIAEREDGIVNVNTNSAAVSLTPNPTPVSLSNFQFDSQSNEVFGQTGNGTVSFALASGAESLISPQTYGFGSSAAVSAINSDSHQMYLVEQAGGATGKLDMINEQTGVITSVPLAIDLVGLAYDYSKHVLYGVTDCCASGLPTVNELVSINTTNGNEKFVANIGTFGQPFQIALPSTLDNNDFYFQIGGSNLVSADVAPDRSWYVEVRKNDLPNGINNWMSMAGSATGLRAKSMPQAQTLTIILDFGAPLTKDGQTGATGFGQFISTVQIEQAVLDYCKGYHDAFAGGNVGPLTVAVGTNNSGSVKYITGAHGAAWAQMIADTNAALSTMGYSDTINALGAMDIELRYSPPTPVSNWKAGFGSSNYVDYGNAEDCSTKNTKCYMDWTIGTVANLAGNYIMPELYNTNGKQADQWVAVSLYAKPAPGQSLNFVRPLTQLYACRQNPPEPCTGTNNSPTKAWLQFSGKLVAAYGSGVNPVGQSSDIEHRVSKK